MLEAFYPHKQPLDHGCRMRHAHFLSGTPHVGLFPVKDSLHQQPVQDSVNVPYSSPPVPHPPSRLHPGEPDEVPEMEIIGLVMVPVFPLAINPLDQGVSGSIHLLSTSVSATAFLLPLVPILRSFCHLDFVTPYHAIPPIFILSIIVPLSHFAPFLLLVRFL